MMRRLEAMVGRAVVQTILTIIVVTFLVIFVAGLVGAIGVIHGWTCDRHVSAASTAVPSAQAAPQAPPVVVVVPAPVAPAAAPKAAPAPRRPSPCPPVSVSPCQSLWDSAQDAQAAYLTRHGADAVGLLRPEDFAAIQNLQSSRPPQ